LIFFDKLLCCVLFFLTAQTYVKCFKRFWRNWLMKKSAHILKSYSLVKFANEYNEFGQQNPYLPGPTGFGATMIAGIPAAIATPMAVQSYNTLRAANPAVAPSFGQVASQTARRFGGAAPVAGTANTGGGGGGLSREDIVNNQADDFLSKLREGTVVGHYWDEARPWTPRIIPSV
jgi:hypothetical protein